MSSKAQVAANRKNAKKSTGPKTPEGKAKVAQNATKHGLTAISAVIKGESQEEYDAHKQSFLECLNPQDAIEDFLADRVVSLSWRLKRATRMQNQLQDAYIADHEYDQKWQKGDYYMPSHKNPDLILGCFAREDYRCDKALERLAFYERRMENSFHKCLNELKHRKRKKPSDPILNPDPDSVIPAPPVIPAQAGIQTRHCEERSDEAIPSAILAANPAKQSQSCECENTATSMESELYHLCANAATAQSKANNNPPATVQDAPRPPYKTTTRRY